MDKNLATAMILGLSMACQPPSVQRCYQSEKTRDPFARRKRKKDKMPKRNRKINRRNN